MSAIRRCAVVVLLLGGLPAPAAAPGKGEITRWVADLASDDPATWRLAVDRLWKAGKPAEPPLRAAMKHTDPDVVLRARLVLSRFDWGLFPDTPAAVARAVERYRDGDRTEQQAAVA